MSPEAGITSAARVRAPAITGRGIFCPLGNNIREFTQSLMTGRDAVGLIRRFCTAEFGDRYGALMGEAQMDALDKRYPGLERRIAMAVASGEEARADAALDRYDAHRIALVFGICVGNFRDDAHDGARGEAQHGNRLQDSVHEIARRLSIEGPALAVSTACSSSAHALGLAQCILENGFADAVMVGGTGDMPVEMFAGFHALGAMGTAPCAPYSMPAGLNLGEGAGCLVLERPDGQSPPHVHGFLLGYGSSLDAYNATAPDPRGMGVALAIKRALRDAGIAARDIGYVNSHGTGTVENDKSEWLGIRKGLGDDNVSIPVSSSKSFIGHTGAAAGILEAIITLVAMEEGVVPPTLHYTRPRRLAPPDPVFSPAPRPASYRNAISCNSAFGGANAAIVLGTNAPRNGVAARRRELCVLGTGTITPAGPDRLIETWTSANGNCLAGTGRPNAQSAGRGLRVSENDLSGIKNAVYDRSLDPVAKFSIAASVLALRDSGIGVDERTSTGIGIVGAVSRVPASSIREFGDSIKQRGLAGVSSRAFSRIVMNAALGSVARHLCVHGPCSNIASGDGAGLTAVASAAMMLDRDRDTSAMLALAMDELGGASAHKQGTPGHTRIEIEGAGCVVIGAAAGANPAGTSRIGGIGLAGPGCAAEAVRAALDGLAPAQIDAVFCGLDGTNETRAIFDEAVAGVWGRAGPAAGVFDCTPAVGYAEASSSMFAFILACLAQAGRLPESVQACGHGVAMFPNIVVLSVSPGSATCAILLNRR